MSQEIIKEPSKGFYIFVWFFNGLVTTLVGFAVDSLLASVLFKNADSVNDVYFGLILGIIVLSFTALLVTILIYSYFKYLKISKVMPYFYIFGAIGFIRAYIHIDSDFSELGVSTTPFGLAYIVAFLIYVLGIRFYFRNKSNW
tara:strand:- start:866 stop:1294 length:429 start_codon:yes stop_codon:yes gene_type:complete